MFLASARRAPVALAGSISSTARFLYAIGGDGGAVSSARDDIEVVPLTPFGALKGQFRTLDARLPGARTFSAGAAIGRFLYVVGGDAGSGAVASVLRAEVLRPEDPPEFGAEIDIALDPEGLSPGLWYYRVSAVMGPTDPDNPGGETLPSEPLAVTVPDWAPEDFLVTLRWSAVPGAAAYRVYRSPVADAPLVAVRRIAQVAATTRSLSDPFLPADADLAPRQLGDLGTWRPLAPLTVPRAEHALTVSRDPSPDLPNRRYLHVYGGRTTGGTALGTYSWLAIDFDPATGGQTVSDAWGVDLERTFAARTRHGGYAADNGVVVQTGIGFADTWMFVGPGVGASTMLSAQLATGGRLSAFGNATNQRIDRSGYGAIAISSQLFLLGGRGTALTASRESGLIDGPGSITNVNNTPGELAVAREQMGSTLGSGRIFLLGGATADGVTRTIESSAW